MATRQEFHGQLGLRAMQCHAMLGEATLTADDYQKLLLPHMDEETPPKLMKDSQGSTQMTCDTSGKA